jgi:aldehyde:ferredoxin oxidoreductase
MAAQIKPKKGCCKSNPRCKRCPVVCKRLVKQGLAERRSDGLVVLFSGVGKKQIKLARKR